MKYIFDQLDQRAVVFYPLTAQGSVHPIIFIFTPALTLGCVNANLFVVPMIEQLHIESSFLSYYD